MTDYNKGKSPSDILRLGYFDSPKETTMALIIFIKNNMALHGMTKGTIEANIEKRATKRRGARLRHQAYSSHSAY